MSTDPWSLSTAAASNTTIGGVSAAEGILPANLNNLDRALAAGLAELVYVMGGAIAAGGTGDVITATTGLSWAAYAAGKFVAFKATATNTGATTLAVDGLAAKSVKDNTGTALTAGTITSGGIYLCWYQAAADEFRLLNPSISTATVVTATATMTDNRIVRADGGARGVQESLVVIDDTTGATYPSTDDLGSLGKSGTAWSDLFLASGAVINFNAGNYTITHSAGILTFSGAVAAASTLELGHATDTTLSRVSAGVIAVEGVTVPTISSTSTLTNKRVTPRIGTTTSSSTPTPDADANDEYNVTALAAGATFGAPTGTPTEGQKLIIRIKDNGTARSLAFNAIYRAGTDVALPTTTVLSKTLYLGFIYNGADTKWDLVAKVDNI